MQLLTQLDIHYYPILSQLSYNHIQMNYPI